MEKGTSWNQILRRERILRGWTKEEVARRLACDSKTVGRWERGEAFPGLYYQRQLVKLFGKSAGELGLIVGTPLDSIAAFPASVHGDGAIDASKPERPNVWQEDWGTAP